jgi:hypothetical protein
MPHALYDQADAYARMRHLTMSELLIDALQLRLDTPVDPRDIVQSQDKDVMAEVRAMVDVAVQAALGAQRNSMPVHVETPAETPAQPPSTLTNDNNATVVQKRNSQPRGRRSGTMRQRILALLAEHPEGLSPEQIRVYLNPEKPIGDVLQGMRRAGVVHLRGDGYQKRYFVA